MSWNWLARHKPFSYGEDRCDQREAWAGNFRRVKLCRWQLGRTLAPSLDGAAWLDGERMEEEGVAGTRLSGDGPLPVELSDRRDDWRGCNEMSGSRSAGGGRRSCEDGDGKRAGKWKWKKMVQVLSCEMELSQNGVTLTEMQRMFAWFVWR